MLISRTLIVAALFAGLSAASMAQTPASGTTPHSPAAASASQPLAATDGKPQAGAKKLTSKRKPAHKQLAKKKLSKRAA